jgi:hypothetical protein
MLNYQKKYIKYKSKNIKNKNLYDGNGGGDEWDILLNAKKILNEEDKKIFIHGMNIIQGQEKIKTKQEKYEILEILNLIKYVYFTDLKNINYLNIIENAISIINNL